MKFVTESERARNTHALLHEISSHLSGRPDCKSVEYIVKISYTPMDDDGQQNFLEDIRQFVSVSPQILICPDRYTRKEALKEPVEDHVIKRHMFDTLVCDLGNNQYHVDVNKLQHGIYKYTLSIHNRRKWVRLDALSE